MISSALKRIRMCQRGGIIMAAEVCTEQQPSTSFISAVSLNNQCYLKKGVSKMVETCGLIQAPPLTADSLPPEIYPQILKYLRRTDIDNCSLVCKRWCTQIERDFQFLAKHRVKQLGIEEDKNTFSLKLRGHDLRKKWLYNKKDIDWSEPNPRKRPSRNQDLEMPPLKFPALCLYAALSIPSTSYTGIIPLVVVNSNEAEKKQAFKKMVHVPPMDLLNRFAKCYRHAEIDTITFNEFRMTDSFVDKFIEVFNKQPVKCRRLVLRFTKLKYVSVEKFSEFIAMFDTKSIKFEWIRDCCGHLSYLQVQERLRDCARSLDISNVTPEISSFSGDFVFKFLTKPEACLLRLEDCDVGLTDLVKIVKRWQQSEQLMFEKVSLTLKDFEWDKFLELLYIPATRHDDHYSVVHRCLPHELWLWAYKGVFYMVSQKKALTS